MPSTATLVLAILTVMLALVLLVQNERYLKARELADRDPVTGLLNHRAMYRQMERELSRAKRSPSPPLFSLVVIDVDNFKEFNDTHGHPAGDAALRRVARMLERYGRDSDVFGRHGGDEFMGLLWNCDREGAHALFGRIAASLAREWGTYHDETLPPIHVSVGVAEYPADASTADDLARAADRALYRHKAHPRATAAREANNPANQDVQPATTDGGETPLQGRACLRPEECFWYPRLHS